MKVQGSCHCGQITYEAEVDPEKVNICNCADCQMLTASALRVGCLKQRAQLAPQRQIWRKSALPWGQHVSAVPGIEGQ